MEDFIKRAKEQNLNVDAVMVIQNDRVLGLHRFTDQIFHNVFSIAKSFLSAAIGFAVDEGSLKLTDKPYDMFSELFPEDFDVRWKQVTLFDLLTMTSGHAKAYLMAAERQILKHAAADELDGIPVSSDMREEWLRFAFSRPIAYEPGTVWRYGNLAPYVAGRMLEKAAGSSVCDYLYKKFWEPLGVKKPRWDMDGAGHTFAASDLYLDITDMIKLGQLYLNKGVMNGRRFLSEGWIEQSTRKHFETSAISKSRPAPDETCGYGFYFWQNTKRGSYRAYGKDGQFVIILPEEQAVIAVQAMHSDVQAILDAVWEEIYPQLIGKS